MWVSACDCVWASREVAGPGVPLFLFMYFFFYLLMKTGAH